MLNSRLQVIALMECNKEHIERLMLEKLLGTLSPADARYLEELTGKEEWARCLWEDMQLRITPSQLQGLNEDAAWEKWNKRYGRSPRLPLYRSLAAAAVILAVIATTLYFVWQPVPGKVPVVAAHPAGKGPVRLVSGNGEELPLSGQDNKKAKLGQLQLAIGQGKVRVAPADQQSTEMNTLFVPPGYDYRIELPDSTEVWLNAASSLRFPDRFNNAAREVYLQGEAYFKVSKDASRPFLVHINGTTVRVLGTEFNVNAYEHDIVKTALVAGSVSVKVEHASPVLLKPGDLGTAVSGKLSVAPFSNQQELSWMQGRYYFKKKSLTELAAIIFRWYNVEVVFDNPNTANILMSGLLRKNQPLTDFLDDLSATSGIHYYFREGTLHLK